MTLGLTFTAPLLLIGLAAAGIPWLLHLLSSVRAREVSFPTLRFLRSSMQKTARRRRIQHWLLLALRSLLLAALAVAVAQPITQSTGGWAGNPRYAAVLVVDNSLSMTAPGPGGSTRLEYARGQAAALLGGDDKPAAAALLTSAGPEGTAELTGQLDRVRGDLAGAESSMGGNGLAGRVARALDMLAESTLPARSVYVFTDMARDDLAELAELRSKAAQDGVHLFVVDCRGPQPATNVGVTDLSVTGRRVRDGSLEVSATLANGSQTAQNVEVRLEVDGLPDSPSLRRTLTPAGADGSIAAMRFRVRPRAAGPLVGRVRIDGTDDIPADNVRHFAVPIADRARALVVRGPASPDDPPGKDDGAIVHWALSPFADPARRHPITSTLIDAEADWLDRLHAADAVFLVNVPEFSPEQASDLARFAADGGTVFFVPGQATRPDAWNRRLVEGVSAEGGLLPARLDEPVGQLGPVAPGQPITEADLAHPYLADLHDSPADFPTLLVKRRFPLEPTLRPGRSLLRLADGGSMLMVKPFGRGLVVLLGTAASPEWSSLTLRLLVPLAQRIALLAVPDLQAPAGHPAGTRVLLTWPGERITPADGKVNFRVTVPGQDEPETVAASGVRDRWEGEFARTGRPGVYRFAPGDNPANAPAAFAINPIGSESAPTSMEPGPFLAMLAESGSAGRTYVGSSLTEVTAAARASAEPTGWWDAVLAVAIVLLAVEAVLANRHRLLRDVVPAHLDPARAPARG